MVVPVTGSHLIISRFAGVNLSNQSLAALEEHLGSPLARANLASLGDLDLLENPNVTSSQQSLLNLTAIGSNFCQGTEQVLCI